MLGRDATDAMRKDCLGFASHREDHTESERYWMSGGGDDAIPGAKGPKKKNEVAIDGLKMNKLCKPQTTGKIMQNKFVVLTKSDKAVAV